MSKYQKLYSLSENLYAEGSPLIIAAGALQKNTENGSIFAQIKFKNIDNRTIKAVRVVISAFDDFGKELGDKEYLYQDISARRDDEFGQKMPVVLDNATRSFVAKVAEVAFADGTKWNESGAEWKAVEKQDSVSSLLKEHELIKQYHIKYGNSCDYLAKTDRDLVLCSCGEVNKAVENSCHKCRNNLSALLSLDIAALTAERDARLAKEAKAAEEKRIAEAKAAEERRIAAEKAKKNAKRNAKITGIIAACAAVCIGLALLTVKVIVPTIKYNNAVKLFNNNQYEEAITAFEVLDGYKDSKENIVFCEKESKYNAAVELMNEEKFEEAIAVFETLDGHKDSTKQINDCQEAIKERDYNAAVELMNNERHKEAIAVFETLDGYKDSAEQINDCQEAIKERDYNAAVELMNNEKYDEAITAFEALNGYKDSKDKALECLFLVQKSNLSGIKKGDTVKFGFYEQDNNSSNGKEEIEWIVLNVDGNKALVISKYALDCQQFNSDKTDVTWESCSLRKWLNSEFLNTAFSTDEQELIQSTNVNSEKNPKYSTNPGNVTNDKVFLLSMTEAEKYFTSDSARQCLATAYVIAQGASVFGDGNCCWWLRSPGDSQNRATRVLSDGRVQEYGYEVHFDTVAVRPALWINLD